MRLIPVTSASETQLNSKKGNTTMCEIKSLNVNQEEEKITRKRIIIIIIIEI